MKFEYSNRIQSTINSKRMRRIGLCTFNARRLWTKLSQQNKESIIVWKFNLTAVNGCYCERITHCVQKKQSFAEWDVNRTAQWLKSLYLYDCIPQEYVILFVKSPFMPEQITDMLNRMRFYPINCLFLQSYNYFSNA